MRISIEPFTCRKCRTPFHAEIVQDAPVGVWCEAVRAVRCPACGADSGDINFGTADWPTLNRERGLLIDKLIAGSLTDEEQKRLRALNAYADYHVERVAPRPAPPANLLLAPCPWCAEGNPRVESSVNPGKGIYVHTDTSIGRVVCRQPMAAVKQEES